MIDSKRMSELHMALAAYAKHLNADYDTWCNRAKINLTRDYNIEFDFGTKYIKVVKKGNSTSVHSFVYIGENGKFKFGDILKAATWKAPATNFVRGNIFEEDSYKNRARWTGIS